MKTNIPKGFLTLPKDLGLDYKVELGDEIYKIKSKGSYTNSSGGFLDGIEGKIYINKVCGSKEVSKWKPKFNSIFNFQKTKKDNLEYITTIAGSPGFECIEDILFTADSFETFYERAKKIAVKNDRIYPDEVTAGILIKKAWKHYDEIYHKFIE